MATITNHRYLYVFQTEDPPEVLNHGLDDADVEKVKRCGNDTLHWPLAPICGFPTRGPSTPHMWRDGQASPVTHSVRTQLSCTNIHQFPVVVIMLLLMLMLRKNHLRMRQVTCMREYIYGVNLLNVDFKEKQCISDKYISSCGSFWG